MASHLDLSTRFRWAFCQLEYLRHCLRQRIRRALGELPDTLDEIYDLTLKDIGEQNWEYAHRLFQCVAAASRPLRVEELAEFLAFDYDAESTPILREDWRHEDPAHAVRSTCSSLLAIVDIDGTRVIQFAHFSVKEYLTSNRLADAGPTLSRFHVSMTQAHTIVAQACLGVLLHIDESITDDGLKKLPLAEYAAEHWVAHARFEDVSRNIQKGMARLFDPKNRHLSIWVWIFDPASPPGGRYIRSGRPLGARGTALHYSAFCGIQDVVDFLIVERSQDVNARSFDGNETPLAVASREGHSGVVRVLLEHGADVGTRDNYFYSPMEHASTRGHAKVVQVLLERGADVNKGVDRRNNTILHLASSSGHPKVVQMILDHGADVHVRDTDNLTPLHSAQDEEVARVLLEHGANPNAQDKTKRTPLYEALDLRRADFARVLLDNGADVNARDNQNGTPLHLASRWGYLDGVKLLLQRGSDIHARDDLGWTPFQVASARKHHDVMKFLLDHNAVAENYKAR